MSLPAMTGELGRRGVSDASISELMTTASRTGQPVTPELLQLHGYRGGPRRQLVTRAARLTRLSHLQSRVEASRFLVRGLGTTQPLPVATSMAMGHQLVQGLAAPVGSLVGRGEMDAGLRPLGSGAGIARPAPPVLNPANLIGATRSDPQVVGVIARTLRMWSTWKLQTESGLMRETLRSGESAVHLVPTEATMRQLLAQMYGQARQTV